ncbi:RebB family R body protein [Archangium lansingense]|uniref:RebB family R body protein n=1 Tax=Archangium lansingense TaxID=2995310 RepID=A0ABT3ZX06_9BACT|nr:RebB family R body protein [Archangium lansinium]MCY1073594.1 RebB family R body protein [Archangium lansinium]
MMADGDKVNLATLGAEAELVQLGMAVADVLAKLNEVSAQQQRAILQLVVDARVACESVRGPSSGSKSAALPPIEPAQSVPPAERAPESGSSSAHPDEVRVRALASVYEAAAQALGLAFQNAVSNQQQLNVLGQAALSQSAVLVLSASSSSETQGAAQPASVLKAG